MKNQLRAGWMGITGMAVRRTHAVVVAALGLLLLCVPAPAGAMIYNLTEIANSQGQPIKYYHSDHQPSINRFGMVAFHAALDDDKQGIFVGNSAAINKIIDTSGLLSELGTPSINDSGDVAFQTKQGDSMDMVLRSNAADSTFTTITDDEGMFYWFHPYVSINNAGTVAFLGSINIDERAVAYGDGGPLSLAASAPSTSFQNVGPPVINTGGSLVEIAFRANQPALVSNIVKGTSSLPPVFLASTGGPFDQWTSRPSINDDGEVLFSARMDSLSNGVYASDGINEYTPVAHSSGTPFYSFGNVAHSTTGSAFEAGLDGGGYGIFTGPSAVADKVIAKGDILQGFPSTVQNVHIGPEALNNDGQLAMQVMFNDGSYRIIRADPFGELKSVPEGLNAAVAIKTYRQASLGREVDLLPLPDRAVLEFEYRFPTTTGELVVKLGGVPIANVLAPRTLTHDFQTVQVLVDILDLFPDEPLALKLEFTLEGDGELSGVLIDDITFPGLLNGDFGTGDLRGWDVYEPLGSAVGVVAPARVPEPSTFILLATATLALLTYTRRRRAP